MMIINKALLVMALDAAKKAETFDAVLAEGRKLWNEPHHSKQRKLDDILDRLAAAHAAELGAVEARAEAAEQDARRYRWLRDRSPFHSSPGGYVKWPNFVNGKFAGDTYPTADDLDAAIDAQQAEGQEPRDA